MAILNFQVDTIGQSGVVPKFIYLNTTNTVAEVTTAGFLNHFVSQGNQISDTDLAVIVTRTTPSAHAATAGLYSISFSGGNWSLTAVGGGSGGDAWLLGGNATSGVQIFGTLSNQPISFRANNIEYMAFNTADSALEISADNLLIEASEDASIEADNIILEAFTAINIGASGNVIIESDSGQVGLSAPTDAAYLQGESIGLTATSAGIAVSSNSASITISTQISGNITLWTAGALKFKDIPSATESYVLFYNPGTTDVSYGAAPSGFNEAGNYTLTGNWLFQAGFDIETEDPISIESTASTVGLSSFSHMTLSAVEVGSYLTVHSDNIQISGNATTNMTGTSVEIGSSTSLVLGGDSSVGITSASGSVNLTATTGSTIQGDSVVLGATNASMANTGVQIYSTDSKLQLITNGASAPINIDSANEVAITTGPSSGGNFSVNCAVSGSITMLTNSGNVSLKTSGGTGELICTGLLVVQSGSSTQLIGDNIVILADNSNSSGAGMTIGTSAGPITIQAIGDMATDGDISITAGAAGTDGNLSLQASGTGFISLSGSTGVKLLALDTQTATAVPTTLFPPTGYSYVVMDDTTGQLYRLTP